MQAQISTLIVLNKPPSYNQGQQGRPAACESQSPSAREPLPAEPTNTICSVGGASYNNGAELSEPRYWGATSSDYTLNVVHFYIQPTQSQKFSQNPSCDNTESSYLIQGQKIYSQDGSCQGIKESGKAARLKTACFCSECTRPLRMLSKAETHRLVSAYQEVVNYLHPILDINHLSSQIDIIYAALEPRTEIEEDIKLQVDPGSIEILNIVLSIALLAQTTGKSEIASALYSSFQNKIQDAAASSAENFQGVLLMLLMVCSSHVTRINY